MSYKNDSYLVILSSYDKAGDAAKAELFETYDRLRDLTASGPALGGSGLGKFGSFVVNMARMVGGAPFQPTLGNESINIPGTSYYAPITGGTGIMPGGQAAFGLAPFAQMTGMPSGGAAPIDYSTSSPLSMFSSMGIGSQSAADMGLSGLGGTIAGGASPILGDPDSGLGTAAGTAIGTAAGAGFGQNWVMPAAGIVSGLGGALTTLGPFFGPFGIAAAAGGAVLNGVSGAVLSSFQQISNRILNNADTILTNKVKNLETTVKELDAQHEVIQKLLKDSVDGDKKALDNI